MGCRSPLGAACALALCLAPVAALRAQTGRLLDASAVSQRVGHMDLSIDFNCTLRYQSHTPASEGDRVRITFAVGSDCGISGSGQFPVDRMLPADAAGLVRSIELQPGLSGGAELTISWNRVEKFVLAPTGGMRGLRVRVPRANGARVLIGDVDDGTASYSVNLESSRNSFGQMAIARAAAQLSAPAFVSVVTVDGEQWYRLRAGPFATRRAADEVLRMAIPTFPTAWLGIGDEAAADMPQKVAIEQTTLTAPARPETRADAQLDRLLEEARTALSRKRLDDAISRLTQLAAAEDYANRMAATELLGLARERKGQLAQAKSVYEDYLRRYPQSRAAPRIRQRLQALRTAALPGRRGSGDGNASAYGWNAYGSASQFYRRDDTHLSSTALSRDVVTQHSLLSDIDGVVRHRGERYDMSARTSFGYTTDLLPARRSKPLRVSAAYMEVGHRELGWGAKFGRQSRGMAGVNGVFDGLLGAWQWLPDVGFGAVLGMPVESTRNGPDTDRLFAGVAANLTSENRRWDTSVYALAQQYSGTTDRRSVGVESRYLRPGRTLVMMADYDVQFGDLNSVLLLGTLITESRWTFNIDAGRQRSPQLSIRNALIGQPTLAFDDLSTLFTLDELEQLAADRAARLVQLGMSASRPIGQRVQWTLSLLSLNLSGTPTSGGVAAIPNPGRDDSISSELLVNSLLKAGDTHSIALRYQNGDTGRLVSAGVGSRLPLGATLRLTTRLRVDHRRLSLDSSDQWGLIPSLRLDYQRGASAFELEGGAELLRRSGGTDERSTRRFVSAGFRMFLDRDRR